MDLRKLLHTLAPVAAVAMAAAVSGCGNADVRINGEEGKRLSDLDLSGAPPHGLVLLGPDMVTITPGDHLSITLEGDHETTEKLRFTLKDGTLGILRDRSLWGTSSRPATVHVIMPLPSELVMTGSGSIDSPGMAEKASVTIAGSGRVHTGAIAAEKLEVNIAGSGDYTAQGHAKKLELSIAGSGSARMEGLQVEKADVSITGSGDSRFASDGTVSANIVGSGRVGVKGRASCTVSAVGSGKLTCEP